MTPTTSVLTVLTLLSLLTSSLGQDAQNCFKKSEEPTTTTTEQSQFSENKLEFTLDMFHKLYTKGGEERSNLFFSPHSIHQALLMAFFGSKGETETELRQALKLGEASKSSKESLIQSYKMENFYRESGCAAATTSPSGYDLKVANKLYFNEEEPIRPCVKEIFEKEIELLNFSNETEKSRMKINGWVEQQTNGKIKDLIPHIADDTRMAIVNSAYFKGTWEQQFKKSNTKLSLFYVSNSEVTPTMMMYQKGSFRHGISEALKSYILELPYEGEALSMFILLPPFTPNALEATISRLNATTLKLAMDEMYPDSLEVLLPRFKIQQTFELSKALKAIGVKALFNESSSDLSDFSDKPGLAVEEAIHKSFLEVNEEGATAAAATALIGTRSGRPLEQTRFVCNHPFVFFIYDNCAKNVLFIGAFHSPTK